MNSIKCPGCGLVNFASAAECKRCQMFFGSHPDSSEGHDANAQYQSYWPQQPEYDEEKEKVFSGGVVFLTGILIVGMLILLLQQALHPFDPGTARGLGGLVG